MQRAKLFFGILLISCFLLNSTMVFALPWESYTAFPNDSTAGGIEQVLSAKDQELIKKFDKAQEWLKNQEQSLTQYLSRQFAAFKMQIDQAFQQLQMKFEDFMEKTLNKNYTLVQSQTFYGPLGDSGLFCLY